MSTDRSPVKYLIFSAFLILVDQATKLLVHRYMEPGFAGQITLIGDWLKLHYVLNPGMAFGMQLGHENGKLFLTLFRLVAMVGIGYYLVHMVQRGASPGFLWAMAMILAGAVGNVIDSTFYGVFLEGNVIYGSATPWFHGQVIDMIFVDFWEGFIPDWVPIWGGQYYSTPIFNVADSCIFVGVCIILIFQGHFFAPQAKDEPGQPSPEGGAFAVGTGSEDEDGAPAEDPAAASDETAAADETAPDTPLTSGQSPEDGGRVLPEAGSRPEERKDEPA